MKAGRYLLLAALLFFGGPALASLETWAYLMKGEEKYFPENNAPFTDIACFSAQIDEDGNLKGGHDAPPTLPDVRPGTRYHLVVTMPWSTTLAHIYLDPTLPFRNRIINGIVERSKTFDGVQIDFESISAKDGTAYLNFLGAVKNALPADKVFSVAVLPRWASHKKAHPNDAFDYPFISRIADRVIVMAYDEHHKSSEPGPIASLPWCRKIHDYAMETIAPEKLVMGTPLYGRGWQLEKTGRSFRNREVWTNIRETNARPESSAAEGGSYSYTTPVTVRVYFETMPSLKAKMDLYSSRPIRGIAFWRIGQEPLNFWDML